MMRRRSAWGLGAALLAAALAAAALASRTLDVPFHEQVTNTSCGAACLESAMEYWGVRVTQKEMLRRHPPKSRNGYSIGELKAIAMDKGLKAFGVAVQMDFLEAQTAKGRPVIVPVMITYDEYRFNFAARVPVIGELFTLFRNGVVPDFSHYIVVCGVEPEVVHVIDPMYGEVDIPRRRFEEMWNETGNAALLVAL
ncbi:MAG: cysteine peptidase family C39 domain-containing protein [Desulfovibrionaceae bacterium]